LGILTWIIDTGNTILWSYLLIVLLIGAGLYFTIINKFVQFTFIKEMVRLLAEGTSSETEGGISSFQAFCMSTASRVGTGNLAGVAIAVAAGGPGAVFWMWVIALIGAASAFVESTLAQIYKEEAPNGYRGGPAYYMEKALGSRKMGISFSVLITISFGLVFNSVQSNTISLAFEEAFGATRMTVGIAMTVLTALIIFGGVKRIAKFTEAIVPVMAIAYVLVAGFVVIKNFAMIPSVFKLIIESAFGVRQAAGGAMGAALMMGIKRGLFSNEAGMGSAPNAAATAEVTHPVKQGLIQALGVFTDTIIICSATAFMILLSGVYTQTDLGGIQLTQTALTSQVGGWGSLFIALCIFLFAFSSIVGNYYYGESNIEFINSDSRWLFVYRLAVLFMVSFGSVAKLAMVWNMADLFMGLMAILNIYAIIKLAPIAKIALDDYTKQKKEGKNPVFNPSALGIVKGVQCWKGKKSKVEVKNKVELV
jgi:AGCS family alanine or glycine:cation symporter